MAPVCIRGTWPGSADRDAKLHALEAELREYPGADPGPPAHRPTPADVVLPLRLRGGSDGTAELSFFSIVAAASTATDVTIDELQIESIFPADAATAQAVRAWQ